MFLPIVPQRLSEKIYIITHTKVKFPLQEQQERAPHSSSGYVARLSRRVKSQDFKMN